MRPFRDDILFDRLHLENQKRKRYNEAIETKSWHAALSVAVELNRLNEAIATLQQKGAAFTVAMWRHPPTAGGVKMQVSKSVLVLVLPSSGGGGGGASPLAFLPGSLWAFSAGNTYACLVGASPEYLPRNHFRTQFVWKVLPRNHFRIQFVWKVATGYRLAGGREGGRE